MQASETLKPHFTERINNPNLPTPEAGPKKEKNWVEKIGVAVVDTFRDIGTANQMAKDTFDGSSALMQAAKGATTTLVGVGLEKAMDEYFTGVMAGSEPLINRTPAKFGKSFREGLDALKDTDPRMHQFVVQTAKDLMVGGAYNGLAFFTRPLLESAKAEHLVGSLLVNAADAWGTKDPDGPKLNKHSIEHRDSLNRQKEPWVKQRDEAMSPYVESDKVINGGPYDPYKYEQPKKVKSIFAEQNLRLSENYEQYQKDYDAAQKSFNEAVTKILELDKELANSPVREDKSLAWQTFLRQYTTYSNPATLLGLNMVGQSMMTMKENFLKVRKIRKEKGIKGKAVEMPKKGGWQDRGDRGGFQPRTGDRREQHKWQDKKVYYGQSNKTVSREEEDLAKAM